MKLYPDSSGPRYIQGHAVTLALVAAALLLFAGMSVYLTRRNDRRAAGLEDYRIAGLSEDEVEEMGDESPRFAFTV
jgi:hypothetical protein